MLSVLSERSYGLAGAALGDIVGGGRLGGRTGRGKPRHSASKSQMLGHGSTLQNGPVGVKDQSDQYCRQYHYFVDCNHRARNVAQTVANKLRTRVSTRPRVGAVTTVIFIEVMLPMSRWAVDPTGEQLLPVSELVLQFPGAEVAPVQIASDLHLEFIRTDCGGELDMDNIVVPSAPILILLGDIGIPTNALYREFLLHQAGRFEAVLVLTGNHEFYDCGQKAPPPREGQTWSEAAAEWGMRPRNSTHDMEVKIQQICDEHERLHY
eukprot:3813531-Rhodomonas_salina.1